MPITLDPVVGTVIRIVLAAIFFMALIHKLRDTSAYFSSIRDYQIVPAVLALPVGVSLLLLELGVVACLLIPDSGIQYFGVMLSAVLLLVYAIAIKVNLVRGRREIDCGCSGFVGPRQLIKDGLVYRNLVLVALAVPVIFPVSQRVLSLPDYMIGTLAASAILLLYIAANTLMANAINLGVNTASAEQ